MSLDKITGLVFSIVPLGIAIISTYLPANYNKELITGIALGAVLLFYAVYTYIKEVRLKKSISNLGIANKSAKTVRKLVKISQLAAKNKDEKTIDLVLDYVKKSDRILLYLGMYKERIAVGQNIIRAVSAKDAFVYKESYMRAKIDYIGWTYVLTGKQMLARATVEEGIKFADDVLARLKTELSTDKGKKNYANMLLLRVRAMRHLCSMPDSKKFCEDFVHLENTKKYLMDNRKDLAYVDKNDVKFNTMMCGIYYGMALCKTGEMFDHKTLERKDNLDIAKCAFDYLDKCDEFIKLLDAAEPQKNLESHRRIKIKLLRDKILAKLKGRSICEIKEFFEGLENLPDEIRDASESDNISGALDVLIEKNLEECMNYFGNNIFVDESMINYLEQRVERLGNTLKK